MKVIWGYGRCKFGIRSSGLWNDVLLNIDSNSYPVDTRVGYEYNNIYGSKRSVVSKIIRRFDIRILRDDNDQSDIVELMHLLRRNDLEYVLFQLHEVELPANPVWIRDYNIHQCIISEPSYANFISDFSGGGNVIGLTLTVKDPIVIDSARYRAVLYRNTATGLWYVRGGYAYLTGKTVQNIGLI